MHQLVELTQISPSILLDIRYATPNNFTGQIVYPSGRCFLLAKTAQRLHRVQQRLQKQGLGLKVYDGYRPQAVQKIFWKICPDPRYVADPAIGSRHSRGASVDLTPVDGKGRELSMPTGFDDFSERASHDYMGGSPEALANKALLKAAMMNEGFILYVGEWWHYDDPDWQNYPLLDFPIPS